MTTIFNKKSTTALIWFALMVSPAAALARNATTLPATTGSATVTLGDVDGETFDQMTVINIRFHGKPTWAETPKVEDHGMFLQISLPDTLVPEPGKFFDGPTPHFPKIAIIQTTTKDAAVRIFTVKPANTVREASRTEILGDRLIMTLDHKNLQILLGQTMATAEPSFVGPPAPAAKNVQSADTVISQTTVRDDLAPPSLVLKKEPKTALTGNGSQVDLRGTLTKVAAFSGIMFLILIATWFVKPKLRRRIKTKKSAQGEELPALGFETLATMALSPRQKLMVVQIGNDRVLLGVSQDSISFLTNLNQGVQPAFQGAQTALQGAAAAFAQQAPLMGSLPVRQNRNFTEALTDESTVEMHPRPTLKKIEGNDPESLRSPEPAKKRIAQRKPSPSSFAEEPEDSAPTPRVTRGERPGSRLSIRIDDNGATKVTNRPASKPSVKEPEKKQAIDDITSIIREKLNTLRTI